MVTKWVSIGKSRTAAVKDSIVHCRITRHWVLVLLWRVARGMFRVEATHLAAGVAYYTLLSLFPLVLGLLAILGIVLTPQETQQEFLDFVTINLPGSRVFAEENVSGLVDLRGALGIGAFLGIIWTAIVGFGAVARAVNRAWGIRQNPPFYTAKPLHAFMALVVGTLFLVSTAISSAIELQTGSTREFGVPLQELFQVSGIGHISLHLVPLSITFLIFLIIYRFTPNCKTFWRYVWPGALIAAVMFETAKVLFLWYLENVVDYTLIYGSVASIIVLMLWVFVSAMILMLGAQIGSEYTKLQLGLERGALIPGSFYDDGHNEVSATIDSPTGTPPP
jgi:membrane protein